MALTNKYFLAANNIFNICREASFLGVSALGMTFVIMTKGIDLSVAAILSLSSVVAAMLIDPIGPYGAILAALAVGAVCGLINGVLVVWLRIPPFITTLGTYNIYRAIAYTFTKGGTLQINNSTFTAIGNGGLFEIKGFGGIPYPFIVLVVCVLIGTVLLKRTSFGRSILAIGNSELASHVAGVNVKRTKAMAYVILGLCTSVCAILLSSRLYSARAEMKTGYEFNVGTIVVVGVCALAGGRGNIVSTGISSLFYVSINNAMNNYNVDPYWQYIINGIILLIAFSMYNVKDMVAAYMEARRKHKEYASAGDAVS
jgi:ribose/xylose/arabinose/galactoside ABC-type transport system permease subunit